MVDRLINLTGYKNRLQKPVNKINRLRKPVNKFNRLISRFKSVLTGFKNFFDFFNLNCIVISIV